MGLFFPGLFFVFVATAASRQRHGHLAAAGALTNNGLDLVCKVGVLA
jgi:hypothetical protein